MRKVYCVYTDMLNSISEFLFTGIAYINEFKCGGGVEFFNFYLTLLGWGNEPYGRAIGGSRSLYMGGCGPGVVWRR